MGLMLAVCYLSLFLDVVLAQCNGPRTITTNSDAELISQCKTYDGDIIIGAGALGDIYLSGIETVTSSLTAADSPLLTSLNAENIASIGGNLQLSNLTILRGFAFPSLNQVQSLSWTDLPALRDLSLDTGISDIDAIHISNTGLINLSGLAPVSVNTIDVNNNAYLETMDLNQLTNATSSMSFQANAPNTIIQFANLQLAAGNLTFRNISGLSVPELQSITGSFTCYGCAMATFRAAGLQSVGGDFVFANTDLQTLEFPGLTDVGGSFQLSDDNQLADISGFPSLDSVNGSIILNGGFSSVNFNSLESVQGNVSVVTTSFNTTICDVFNNLHTDEVIQGTVTCRTSVSNSTIANSTSTVDPSSKPTDTGNSTVSGLNGGPIVGVVAGAVSLLVLLGLVIFFFYRRHTQNNHPPATSKLETEYPPNCAQLPGTQHEEKAEMYVDPRNVKEIQGQERFAAELESKKGRNRRTISGVHEVEGDSGFGFVGNRRRNGDMSVMGGLSSVSLVSPVSPFDGIVTSESRSGGGSGS